MFLFLIISDQFKNESTFYIHMLSIIKIINKFIYESQRHHLLIQLSDILVNISLSNYTE